MFVDSSPPPPLPPSSSSFVFLSYAFFLPFYIHFQPKIYYTSTIPFFYVYVCVSIYYIYLSDHLSVFLPITPSYYRSLSFWLRISSVCLFIYQSVCKYTFLLLIFASVSLSACVYICLFALINAESFIW